MGYLTSCAGGPLARSGSLALPSRSTVAVFAGILAAGTLVPFLAGRMPVDGLPQLSAFLLAAMLTSCLREPSATNRAIMPPTFVVIFSSLMLMGGTAAMAVAAAAALTPGLVMRRQPRRQALVDAVAAAVAVQSAVFAHLAMSRVVPNVFAWPWLAIPLAAAIVVYHPHAGRARERRRAVRRAAARRSIVAGARAGRMPDLPARRRRRRGDRHRDRSADVGHRAGARRPRCCWSYRALRRLHAPARGSSSGVPR